MIAAFICQYDCIFLDCDCLGERLGTFVKSVRTILIFAGVVSKILGTYEFQSKVLF